MPRLAAGGPGAATVNPTLVTAILCTSGLGVVSQLYIPIPLIGYISDRFGVTAEQAALVGSMFGLPYAAAFLFFGPWSDQVGRKFVLVLGLSLLGLSSLLVAFVPSFEAAVLTRVLQGFCAASFSPVALAYLPELVHGKARATGMAFLTTSLFASGIAGQVYASIMVIQFGWVAMFAVTAVFYGATAIVIQLLLPKSAQPTAGVSFRSVYAVIPSLVMQRRLLAVYLVSFIVLMGFVAFYSALGPQLWKRYSIGPSQMIWVRAAGLPAMAGALLVGPWLPRFGSYTFICAGLATAAIGFGLTSVPGPLPWIIGTGLVFVLGTSLMVPSMIFRINELVTVGRGAAAALYTLLLFAGASLGVLIGQAANYVDFVPFCMALAATYLVVLLTFVLLNRPG